MIRLVTCDIDGTLLHGEETSIDTETLEEIRRLREKGILFCPASGRQYHSLRRLFAPVQDEIAYICEDKAISNASDLYTVICHAWMEGETDGREEVNDLQQEKNEVKQCFDFEMQ